jgi:hypothetical protein
MYFRVSQLRPFEVRIPSFSHFNITASVINLTQHPTALQSHCSSWRSAVLSEDRLFELQLTYSQVCCREPHRFYAVRTPRSGECRYDIWLTTHAVYLRSQKQSHTRTTLGALGPASGTGERSEHPHDPVIDNGTDKVCRAVSVGAFNSFVVRRFCCRGGVTGDMRLSNSLKGAPDWHQGHGLMSACTAQLA